MNRKSTNNREYYRVAARLLYNALRFRFCRLRNRPVKPAVISLSITSRCNSHCIMCNIWKSGREIPDIKSLELSGQEIIGLLSKPLFSELVELDLTGGEPHLRDDLVDIVLGIARLKKDCLPGLRSIIITSNGFLPQRIISNYKDILNALKDTHIDLVSVTSLDGIEDTHDQIRGVRGAFRLTSETISGLIELRKEFPNFITGIKTTILPRNIDALDEILGIALSDNFFHIISPVLFTEARFRNIDKRDELMLGTPEYYKVLRFYCRDELKTSYFYSMARNFLATDCKRWSCTALYNYLFIDYDGKVYPCEIIPEAIGDVKKQDIADIWNSPRAQSWRKKIGKLECCRTCHEPGAIRYSAFAEGLSYLKFLTKLGKNEFVKSWRGEGFSKYNSGKTNK